MGKITPTDKPRDQYRDEAVQNAEEQLLSQFTGYEWDFASGPASFRRLLVSLWEDGAAIGSRDG